MKNTLKFVTGLALALISSHTLALNGISVTVHWEGANRNRIFYGGFGEIWRHDIQDSQVVERTKIHDGPARMVVLNHEGTHLAFINEGGTISVMSVAGGPAVDLAETHQEGCLDWPRGDWIYYSLGGWEQHTGSRYLHRVHAKTGIQEPVVQWNASSWRFHIASDNNRMVVRDTSINHAIVAYELSAGDGVLREARATDSPSCGTGMDPDGEYFMDGMPEHQGFDIRRWDNLEIVSTFTHADVIDSWGGPDSGTEHNRNLWSTNSQKWLCAHVGWDTRHSGESRGANQVLYNWIDGERFVVTENDRESYAYDSAGDLWVDQGSDNLPPTVNAGKDRQVVLPDAVQLTAQVADDGQLRSQLAMVWSQQEGPAQAVFTSPYTTATGVHFVKAGTYVLSFAASDGQLQAEDTVEISVVGPDAASLLDDQACGCAGIGGAPLASVLLLLLFALRRPKS